MYLATIAVVAGAALLHGASGTTCMPVLDGVQYDFTSLQRPVDAPYNIQDAFDSNTNFTFNVCNDVDAAVLPNGPSFLPARTSVPAYQYQVNFNTVFQLSKPADQGWNYTLLDSSFKARGAVLHYSGGANNFCSDGAGNPVSRGFSISVECDPSQSSNVFDTEVVVESDNCHYEVQLLSVYGCPAVCHTGSSESTTICSGQGVCGYNEAAEAAQCYCNEGFEGAACGEKTKAAATGITVEGVFLIIACVGLVAVLGGIVFMIARLRKLRIDPTAYQGLTSRFNELGQLSA